MLTDDDIQLVIVNTPNYTHFEFAKKALEAGKHVVVEKPFTVKAEEGEMLLKLAKENNVYYLYIITGEMTVIFLTVKKVLDHKLLGKIVEAEIHFDRYSLEASAKKHKETDLPGTGVLYDLGVHLIDEAIELFGMPEALSLISG
jgi:predicted dehydrogenase